MCCAKYTSQTSNSNHKMQKNNYYALQVKRNIPKKRTTNVVIENRISDRILLSLHFLSCESHDAHKGDRKGRREEEGEGDKLHGIGNESV